MKKFTITICAAMAGVCLLCGAVINPAVIKEYLSKITGTSGNIPSITATGQLQDSGIAAANVATTATLANYYTEAEAVGLFVPVTRTVNGKALSSNISLAATDITAGAAGTMYYSNGTSLIALAPDNGKYLRSSISGASWETVTSGLQAVASQATGDILYAADSSTLARLPIDAGKYLKANAGGTGYEFSTVSSETIEKITASQTAEDKHFYLIDPTSGEIDLTVPDNPTAGMTFGLRILNLVNAVWLYTDSGHAIESSYSNMQIDIANFYATWAYEADAYGWVRIK